MPSIKNALCLLAVVAAYGLAAYWDADEEPEGDRRDPQGDSLTRMASDESPVHVAPTTHGVQHAHR